MHTGNVRVITPRKRGFRYRPILVVIGDYGLTCSGELVGPDDGIVGVPEFLLSVRDTPHMISTFHPDHVLNQCIQWCGSRDDDCYVRWLIADSIPDGEDAYVSEARISKLVIERPNERHRTFHSVFDPSRALGLKRASDWSHYSHLKEMLALMVDIRSWCQEQDVPFGASLPAIASSLARDRRFWPENRRPVPHETNRRVRKWLPGIHQEINHPTQVNIPEAIAMDQSRAYHRIAQVIDLPDPNTLFAQGYFNESNNPENLWAPLGSPLYLYVTNQPGIAAVICRRGVRRQNQFTIPTVGSATTIWGVRYLWTNELPDAIDQGLEVRGLSAAWTSSERDDGFRRYGKWAEEEINGSTPSRREWLKPCLHALYGLHGARRRHHTITGNHVEKGRETRKIISTHSYNGREVRRPTGPSLANVAALGVLQSEVRRRTILLANRLGKDRVTHIHADGLHVLPGDIPEVKGWTAETIQNLVYVDKVSWISEQKDVLPGRSGQQRAQERRWILNAIRPSKRRRAGV